MTISVQITNGSTSDEHGKIAVDTGSAAALDENMEVIREGKEQVLGVSTVKLGPGESIIMHVWHGQEIVVREVASA